MQVCDVMTRTVVTANPEATFHELVDLLIRHRVSDRSDEVLIALRVAEILRRSD